MRLSLDPKAQNLPVVEASFFYIQDDLELYKTEKPYLFTGLLPPDREHLRTNIVTRPQTGILVRDLKNVVTSLDIQGFQIVRHEIAKKFRKDSTAVNDSSKTRGTAQSPDVPIWPVHVDFTEEAGMQRVKKMLTDSEAQLYLGGEYRIRIINSWRPLYRPVKNSPLGFCDPWTIQKQDLVAVDRPAQDQSSEAYYVKYGAHQDYYWCSNQSQKEISIFTSWDSKPENSPPCKCFTFLFIHTSDTQNRLSTCGVQIIGR
ncbi:hypothetical protein ONS96_001936 [Cadophora gregata f. sp. sojae]|nr:hypothetical protein ONS96_001936 [Cadophora gregata f. sp. sojae]